MKESSYHDAKMATYCQEVRRLEDKYNGLKLNHIPRRLNEAADALTKVVSGQELVPMGVFASDQHKPLVRYEGSKWADNGPSNLASRADPLTSPSNPKVIELEEDPAAEPDPPND